MDINIYDLKLQEIDKKIKYYQEKANLVCVRSSDVLQTNYNTCVSMRDRNRKLLIEAQNERKKIVAEMEKEQQYLKDQYILQQQQATAFAEQQALKAAEEVRAAANKTEQELQIAKQKEAQANEALAKQQAAESLAKSVDTGNLEAGRILMGINTVSKYKTPLIIGAVTLTVLALGFVGYKMLAKAKKV